MWTSRGKNITQLNNVKIIVSSGGFSPSFLSIGIKIWGQHGHKNIKKGYIYNSNGVITSIIWTQHYPILIIEVGLSPIESLAMIRFLLYKHKLNNIDDHRLPKLALNFGQNHLSLNWGWHK